MTDTKISVRQALAQACENARMYRFGKGWVIRTWLPERKAWYEFNPAPWAQARSHLSGMRHAAALRALGWNQFDAECAALRARGPLASRVRQSLRENA